MRLSAMISSFRELWEPVAPPQQAMLRLTSARTLQDQLSRTLFFFGFCLPSMLVAGMTPAMAACVALVLISEGLYRATMTRVVRSAEPPKKIQRVAIYLGAVFGAIGYAAPGPLLASHPSPAVMAVGLIWVAATLFHTIANFVNDRDMHYASVAISGAALLAAALVIGLDGARPATPLEHGLALIAALLFLVHLWTIFIGERRTQLMLEAMKEADRRRAEEAAHAAAHDGLTGLPNRAELGRRLGQALARPRRRVAAIVIDLDGFKPVNDRHGHAVGDLLLQRIARRLRRLLRGADFVARIGGDEFVVVSIGVDEAGALALADRIVAALARPFHLGAQIVRVGASLGVALRRDVAGDAWELVAAADAAMYVAKRREGEAGARHLHQPAPTEASPPFSPPASPASARSEPSAAGLAP